MNIGGNFPPPTYYEAHHLELIYANNVPIFQVSPEMNIGGNFPLPTYEEAQHLQPISANVPISQVSPQPYGLGIQLPSITQPQSSSSIPVGASTHLQPLHDPSDDSVFCPRCQQQFVRTQRSSGCIGYVEVIPLVGFLILTCLLAAQIIVGENACPFEGTTSFSVGGFLIFVLSMVVTVIADMYCQNKMINDVPQNCPNCRQAGGNAYTSMPL